MDNYIWNPGNIHIDEDDKNNDDIDGQWKWAKNRSNLVILFNIKVTTIEIYKYIFG